MENDSIDWDSFGLCLNEKMCDEGYEQVDRTKRVTKAADVMKNIVLNNSESQENKSKNKVVGMGNKKKVCSHSKQRN